MRRFVLIRDRDVTGVSGTGIVAEGVVWTDGTVTVKWRGPRSSEVSWPGGVDDVEAVHGHGGATRIQWVDEDYGIVPHPIAAGVVALDRRDHPEDYLTNVCGTPGCQGAAEPYDAGRGCSCEGGPHVCELADHADVSEA